MGKFAISMVICSILMLDYQRVLFLILHDPRLLVRSALLFWIFVEMSEPWPFLTDITVPGRSIPYH